MKDVLLILLNFIPPLLLMWVMYRAGYTKGRQDAWADAETMGARISARIKKEGIKVMEVPTDLGTLEIYKKFDEIPAPTNKRDIN